MYHFSDDIHYNQFFRFDKKWIENMNWAMLPKNSKAVLPVIAAHCNAAGEAFPSEATIAILSGLREKAVRSGVNGLIGFPGFQLSHYVSARGRRAKKFRLVLPPEGEKNRSFFFFKHVIEGGNWRELNTVSQALYPVMRYYGYFDGDVYYELEDESEADFDSLYEHRKWDCCEADLAMLQHHSGIRSRQSMYDALKGLQERFLIEPLHLDDGVRRWKVFIKPSRRYKPAYLNETTMKRLMEKEDCPKKTGHAVQKKEKVVQKRLGNVQK